MSNIAITQDFQPILAVVFAQIIDFKHIQRNHLIYQYVNYNIILSFKTVNLVEECWNAIYFTLKQKYKNVAF